MRAKLLSGIINFWSQEGPRSALTCQAPAGCRVSVALTKGTEDLKTLLSHDAKPYITTRLLSLFDQQPHKLYADTPPLDLFFSAR